MVRNNMVIFVYYSLKPYYYITMAKTFRPMLAAKCGSFQNLRYPVYATPKLDGIRTLTKSPVIVRSKAHRSDAVTRNLNEIPNRFIFSKLMELPPGLDGELMSGTTFNSSSSAIMSHDGFPDFKYIVFDFGHEQIFNGGKSLGYLERMKVLSELTLPDWCEILQPVRMSSVENLEAYEQACIESGYEGAMIRTGDSPYKFGRSTLNEQWLLKIKRFEDSEAVVIGVEEKYTNTNEPTINPLGYQERSTHQANMSPAGVLGALLCRDIKTNVEFSVGTGFDDLQRNTLWSTRSLLEGRVIKYKHQPYGQVDKPRFPVFLGFRDKSDF